MLPSDKHYTGGKCMNILGKQNSRSLKEWSNLQRPLSLHQDATSVEAEQLKTLCPTWPGVGRSWCWQCQNNITKLNVCGKVCKERDDSGPPGAKYKSTLWNREGLWPGGDGMAEAHLRHTIRLMQNNLICSPDSGRPAAVALLKVSMGGREVHLWSAEGGRQKWSLLEGAKEGKNWFYKW